MTNRCLMCLQTDGTRTPQICATCLVIRIQQIEGTLITLLKTILGDGPLTGEEKMTLEDDLLRCLYSGSFIEAIHASPQTSQEPDN